MPPELQRRAIGAAHAYRLGMDGQASDELARVVGALLEHVARSPALGARLAPLVGTLSAAQARRDWIALADGLEFELPALLR